MDETVTAPTPEVIKHAPQPVGKVTLRKGREDRVRQGHPWVFSGEVYQIPGPHADGQIVAVEDQGGRFMGLGLTNTKSNI